MRQYLDLLADLLDNGYWHFGRASSCRVIAGAMLRFDLQVGFPILTTRQVSFKPAVAEMIDLVRGSLPGGHPETSYGLPSTLRETGKSGASHAHGYGNYWRRWIGEDDSVTDQLVDALNMLVYDPGSHRIIVNGWKPEHAKQACGALPASHVSWHLLPDYARRDLSLCVWQRSVDIVQNASSIVGYAFLLAWIARLTGYTPRWLVMHMDEVSCTEENIVGLLEQLRFHEPRPLPALAFDESLPRFNLDTAFDPTAIERIEPDQVWLEGYL